MNTLPIPSQHERRLRPGRRAALALVTCIVALAASAPIAAHATGTDRARSVGEPHTHQNVSIYLVHGGDAYDTASILTLEEALAKGVVVVHETGSVNQLAVENVSSTDTVFVQAGDIVKGGQQDRTMTSDLFLGPQSGRVDVDAFCVESGRWRQRAGEDASRFQSSSRMLSSKELKLAVRGEREQSKVWAEVAGLQRRLAERTGDDVRSEASPTSLQLSLEDGAVARVTSGYVDAFRDLAASLPDSVGLVVAIDGELNSAEIYASHDLFAKKWPKLLDAIATEGAASRVGRAATPPSRDAAAAFLARGEAGTPLAGAAPGALARESEDTLYFEAGPAGRHDAHKSYLAK